MLSAAFTQSSSEGSTIGMRERRRPAMPAVKQLMYVFCQSIFCASETGMKSAKPMPRALPAETSVTDDSQILYGSQTFAVTAIHAPRTWEVSRRVELKEVA